MSPIEQPREPRSATVEVTKMKTRSDQTLVHDLRELIAALDRRVPRLEREGERDIAHDAQALRRAALKRISELERSLSPAATDSVGSVG
jgi:hypothetical protein